MQASEASTRNSILAAARAEFLEQGYRKAGLREIARKAGVTTGALYGYFKNKEELFTALVGEPYEYLTGLYRAILGDFSHLPPEEQQTDMQEYTRKGISVMTKYIYEHHDAFKLILCCSEGTKYSDLVHELAQMDVGATHDFSKTSAEMGYPVKAVNPALEHILTSGMFSAYFELVIHDIPYEQAEEYITQLLDFYSAGWMKIMGM